MTTKELKNVLGKTDMYLIDLLQKGYFNSPLKILDAGCGKGRNMRLFANLGNKVWGIDQDSNVIKALKNEISESKTAWSNVNVGVGELDNLSFENGYFDMVICNAVLHFSTDSVHFKNMVRGMVRVLKPKGVLFLRFVSSHTLEYLKGEFNQWRDLPDGSARFVVDMNWVKKEIIEGLNLSDLEAYKTVNIDGKRSMTTLVLRTE